MMDEFRFVLTSRKSCFICKLQGSEICKPQHSEIRRKVNAKRETLIKRFKNEELLPPYCACRNPGCYMPQIWCKFYDKSLLASERQCIYRFIIVDLLYTLREISTDAENHFVNTLNKSGTLDEAKYLSQEWRINSSFRSMNLLGITFEMYRIYMKCIKK